MAQNASSSDALFSKTTQPDPPEAASPTTMSDSASDQEPGGVALDPAHGARATFSSLFGEPHVDPPNTNQQPASSSHDRGRRRCRHTQPIDDSHYPRRLCSPSTLDSDDDADNRPLVRRSAPGLFPPRFLELLVANLDHSTPLDVATVLGLMDPTPDRSSRSTPLGQSLSNDQHDRPFADLLHMVKSQLKRARAQSQGLDGNFSTLMEKRGAVATLAYRIGVADAQANDVWPNIRDVAKLPVRYHIMKKLDPKHPIESQSFPPKTSEPGIEPTELGSGDQQEAGPYHPIYRSQWQLPVELVEIIANYLHRDDIKSMRLVSQELNHYTSQILFKTVVVPFNTEIYGMLGQPDIKGKKNVSSDALSYTWNNRSGGDVYDGHGLDVFRGFGRHITRFGMSFEISEDTLANAPEKSSTEQHVSFWGSYDWPFEQYRRFADVAGLETTADETPRMTIAFSELSKVKELALSIDSGLGWLNGPDWSLRARILQKPPEVFGTLKKIPDRRTQAQHELWEHIKASHEAADSDIKSAHLYRLGANDGFSHMREAFAAEDHQPELPFLDPHILDHAVSCDFVDSLVALTDDPTAKLTFPSPSTGVLFTSAQVPSEYDSPRGPVIPNCLTKAQREWLLETEWAQRAFVSSYMLSVIDNPSTFRNVHSLIIPRMPDRYIPLLNRPDFWDALPNLKSVTLMVIPSWRDVSKDEAGWVATLKVSPEDAIAPFYQILTNIISQRSNITELTVGWATGGEHAEGIYARNKLILPAPLTNGAKPLTSTLDALPPLLQLPFVEKLTLKNCWLTPPTLTQFVQNHDCFQLKHLVLDSVSLTGMLRPRTFHIPNPLANPPAAPAPPNHVPPFNQGQALMLHVQALQAHIHQMQMTPGHAFQGQLAALHNQLQQFNPPQPHQPGPQHNPNNHNTHVGMGPGHQLANFHAQVNSIQNMLQQLQQTQAPPQPAAPLVSLHTQFALNPRDLLQLEPRTGCWVNVIDIITPGPNLSDFGSPFSKAVASRKTNLESIQFLSCGYVRLRGTDFEQLGLESTNEASRSELSTRFSKRHTALSAVMLSNSKYELLGEIVQAMNENELAALSAGWFLETGWDNAEEAHAVEFDGLAPGGTGRFTGHVRRDDRVQSAPANENGGVDSGNDSYHDNEDVFERDFDGSGDGSGDEVAENSGNSSDNEPWGSSGVAIGAGSHVGHNYDEGYGNEHADLARFLRLKD